MNIAAPPQIAEMQDRSGNEKSSVNLVCEARGDPIPNIIWTKEGSNVQYAEGTTIGVSIYIKHFTSKLESQPLKRFFLLQNLPVNSFRNIGKIIYEKLMLDLQDISAQKEVIQDQNNPGAKLTLSLSNLKASDRGMYRCNATNAAATTSKTVMLEVRCKLKQAYVVYVSIELP